MLRAGSLVVLLFVVVRADVTYADISAQLLNLRATKLSVDHAGNLWAWNKMTNVVTRFTTAGTVVESAELPKSDNVDADTNFGIATLSHFGRSLDVFDWTGHVRFHVPVAESACDLAWIDADHIAISSSYADHRLEIWRLSSREMTRSIGACNGVSRMPGVNPAHATLIKYDQERKEILTLDAFSAEFQVFSREGTLLRRASVENPHRADI